MFRIRSSFSVKKKSKGSERICDLGLGKDFLDRTPEAWSIFKNHNLDYIKIKNFYSSIVTVKKIKTSNSLVENICKTHIC